MFTLKDARDYAKNTQKDVSHGLRVEKILLDINVTDKDTRVAAILHQTVSEGKGTFAEIKGFFSQDISNMVLALTRIKKISLSQSSPENIAKIKKIIMALATDYRVFVIKMACRLDTLRRLSNFPRQRQLALAKQALEIDSILADSASLKLIASEMQDIGFKTTEPEKYKFLSTEMSKKKAMMQKDLEQAKDKLSALLKTGNINATISFRQKSLYSTHLKILKYLKLHKLPKYQTEGIFDLLGMRVIVANKKDCYKALDIVHKIWTPITDEFDDYIAKPKPNGYQSIHTVIKLLSGNTCEVQIRTTEMDRYNTYGDTSHLGYKMGSSIDPTKWVKNFLTKTKEETDPLKETVFVFTPKHDIVELPVGATPIDFAYHIHTSVGDKSDKAIVNGKIEKLSYILQNGDEISIQTTNRKTAPPLKWLDFAKTRTARHHIRSRQIKSGETL
jgi:GTP pyrophosphokinase